MNSWPRSLTSLIFSFIGSCIGSQAIAATLDSGAARNLVLDRMWQSKQNAGSGYIYWSWKSDGSVCLRLEDKHSKCADTGRWKLNGERLCYELTWWGASYGRKSACFRIADQGESRYEALQDNGLTLFEFSVAE